MKDELGMFFHCRNKMPEPTKSNYQHLDPRAVPPDFFSSLWLQNSLDVIFPNPDDPEVSF